MILLPWNVICAYFARLLDMIHITEALLLMFAVGSFVEGMCITKPCFVCQVKYRLLHGRLERLGYYLF